MLSRPVNRWLRSSRSRAARSVCLCVPLLALFALESRAQTAEDAFDQLEAAQEQEQQEAAEAAPYDGRWLPTLSIGMSLMLSPQSATAASTGDTPEPEPVFVADDQLSVSPQFTILAGLESPELVDDTRVYVSGGVVPTIAFNIDITKEGDPRGLTYPPQRDDNIPYPEAAIDGQGIRTTAQIQPLAFAANLGVSYGREIGGRRLDFRPSVGFYYHSVRAEGVRLRAVKPETDEPFVREIQLFDDFEQSFPAVGPAFELGVDLGRKGSFKPTVYVDASFYHVLGDRTIEMSHAGTDTLGTQVANWTMTVDPWAYRIGLGLRVAWIGK